MDIGKYLRDQGVEFELHEHAPAYTAQEVAAEEHVSGNILAKSVLVRDEAGYALCVVPASFKLDMKKVARARKSKRVQLADEAELAKVFSDVEVGAEPPFGNLYNLPTLVDEHLAQDEEIIFQAGTHRQAVKMKYSDYAGLAQPTVADLAVHL
jgi:Ala-tRNA(Pro) deacylase